MKKIIMLGLTMIFLIVIAACSNNNNNSGLNNSAAENKVIEAPVVNEEEPMEHNMDMDEHAAEPAVEAEVDPAESTEVAKPAVVEQVAVEPKQEAAKPEVVEPKKQPTPISVELTEPTEPTEPAAEEPEVVEPTPAVVAPTTHKVDIVNFAFSPDSLEISVGDIVEFTNLDTAKHSAVEDNGVFDTGLLGKGESKSITFSESGEFGYYCGPHPNMRAKIIVK